ncbi:MAG: oligopeptide transporter, OPT family [Deltaproteobacteria bacterium]|nr:oligopeptide transporter, OPT family [Deltaproteobacteria bacterium]
MVIVFSAACVYIALRAGNGIEASIPIAILAIFFGMMKKIKSTILENVMVQSVGQAAGVVAAGATFVVPALYINQLGTSWWWQIFIACTVGGILGVVMIIPLRKYFVKDLHGELPFPEATAINEVLITGESSAGGAGKILILAFLLGAGFDFLTETIHLWNAGLTTDVLPWGVGESLSGLRIEIQIAGIAALFGLGYIIGIKYASIIASGSVLAYIILVPLIYLIGKTSGTFAYAGKAYNLTDMSSYGIFSAFIKPIGIGAIAISGLIGIIRMGKIVVGSVTLGFKGLSKTGRTATTDIRTQTDISPRNVLLIQLITVLVMGAFFFIVAMTTEGPDGATYSSGDSLLFAVVGMLAGFLLSFLFTPVAAQAIAIVGVNPVSGMTLITVVLAISMLILVGLKGDAGMIIALIVGTAVCTALSTSGALISDFKVGYWVGATPRNQQRWKFLGIVVAALVVALVIPLMDEAYQFLIKDPTTGQWISNDKILPAPQANMIAAVSKGLMSDPANQPWILYGLGGLVAILLLMAGVPMLAFALGMYLPISINMAVLAGAICAWLISKTGGSEKVRKTRAEQGTLIASGLMAGAALIGILAAVFRLPSLGAPIQYMSVGADYRLEAVVEGEVVRKDGKVVQSCDEVDLGEDQTCSLLLNPQPYRLDENDVLIYDQTLLNETRENLRILRNNVETIASAGRYGGLTLGAIDTLDEKLGRILDGERLPAPVVGTGALLSSSASLKYAMKLQHVTEKSDQSLVNLETASKVAETTLKIDRSLHPMLSHPWYAGGIGKGLGFLMLVVLGVACYLLARMGARWQLANAPPDEPGPDAGSGADPQPATEPDKTDAKEAESD